jgi:NAD-dependent DNA ligase
MINSPIDVKGVGSATARLLAEAGFTSIASIANAELQALEMVHGVGSARAASLRTEAQRLLAGDEQVSAAVDGSVTSRLERSAKKPTKKAKSTKPKKKSTKKAKSTKPKKKSTKKAKSTKPKKK